MPHAGLAVRKDEPQAGGNPHQRRPDRHRRQEERREAQQRRRLEADDVEPDGHQHALRERRAEDAVDDRARRAARDVQHVQAAMRRDAPTAPRSRAMIASPSVEEERDQDRQA